MSGPMRTALDASIDDALRSRDLFKTRHGALIKAAQLCADIIDISDDPNAAMMASMLKYITALGLAPNTVAAARERKKDEPKHDGMTSMRAKFHAVG